MDNLNIKFIDEVATNKNQFIITYENGTTDTITLNRNAVVSQNGTPLSANVFNQIVTYCNSLNTNKVPNTRKINNKTLTTDIILNASDIGLGNVDNTSDLNKPISNATQTELDLKANISDLSNVAFNVHNISFTATDLRSACNFSIISALGDEFILDSFADYMLDKLAPDKSTFISCYGNRDERVIIGLTLSTNYDDELLFSFTFADGSTFETNHDDSIFSAFKDDVYEL